MGMGFWGSRGSSQSMVGHPRPGPMMRVGVSANYLPHGHITLWQWVGVVTMGFLLCVLPIWQSFIQRGEG